MASQSRLLRERRFLPFFLTQFLGAANDNVFKFAFTLLATYHTAELTHWSSATVVNAIAAVFVLPFLLFSATCGQLADKCDKTRILQGVKALEVGIMLLGAYGFLGHHAIALLSAVFLLGVHSTVFGPAKYAYLPQHLNPQEIVGGNGLVEMGTFVAILMGTIGGGMLYARGTAHGNLMPVVAGTLVLAGLGVVTSLFIPRTPSLSPNLRINWNPVSETLNNLRIAARQRAVFLSILGISWLWFFGAVFLTQFSPFAKDVLRANDTVVTLLLTVFSIGIALGSALCERLSGRQVEIGLVPFGSIGMTVFAMDLCFASHSFPATLAVQHGSMLGTDGLLTLAGFVHAHGAFRLLADLFLMAMFAGFYSVPLYALIQTRCEPDYRSRIAAANNILNALFMIVSSGVAAGLFALGLSIPTLFLVVGLLNALVALYIYSLVPEFLLRFVAWMLIHTVYRLRKVNTDAIPETGAALLVCNHVSFADAVILMAISPRPIRFVMHHRIFKTRGMRWFFRIARAIPIASGKDDPVLLEQAMLAVSDALKAGDLVCIFPEGRVTDTGEMYPFKNGVRRIVERDPVPVIPLALRGMWGSFFSRAYGRAMSRPFARRPFARIAVHVGEPMSPEEAIPERLFDAVAALRGDDR